MKPGIYLKDKIFEIALLFFALITIEILLFCYPVDAMIRIYIPVSILAAVSIGMTVEYQIKKHYYNRLSELEELDQKYLITEVVEEPSFAEGKILYEILQETEKSRLENVSAMRRQREDYKDYIEMWIHEVKLPIAGARLILENHPEFKATKIGDELDRIEAYTEQALYYARSSTVEKDYLIRKCSLKEIVNAAVRKNKRNLIASRFRIDIRDVDKEVYADSKWMIFILGQIIGNSIKYSAKEDRQLSFSAEEKDELVILSVRDNGIGIEDSEQGRVFDKGFTGTNGRLSESKSTGLGLYLCKTLCEKMGIGIALTSEYGKFTEVQILFPKGSHTDFE